MRLLIIDTVTLVNTTAQQTASVFILLNIVHKVHRRNKQAKHKSTKSI